MSSAKTIAFLAISLAIAVLGCVSQEGDQAKAACIALCRSALSNGQDLSSGPCLSNNITQGYVCDVAHSPRQDVDNLPRNQCPAYGPGKHFVEVDLGCNFIRVG